MKTTRDRSQSTSHNFGLRPLYQPRRFRPGPNRRRNSAASARLAVFGLVLLILAVFALYRILSATTPPEPPEPPGIAPSMQFRGDLPELRSIGVSPITA